MRGVRSYPFPVLGNGDDVGTVLPELTLGQLIVGPTVRLSVSPAPPATGNSVIDGLVSEERAAWFMRLHCARSYYRAEARLDLADPTVSISTDEVEGPVVAGLFVIATQRIVRYRPELPHEDYGDAEFSIEPGEVLAALGEFEFLIEPRFDPLRADPPSLIQFEKLNGEQTGPFRIDTTGDTILAYLPEVEWQLVHELKDDVPDLLHACLALPALTAALRDRHGDETRRWAGRLQALIHARGISEHQPPEELAQALLALPLTRGLAQAEHAIGHGAA